MKTTTLLFKTFLSSILCLWFMHSFGQNPNLVWSDEFEQATFNGSTFGGTNPIPGQGFDWHIQEGNGCNYGVCGWGNNELQNYRAQNVYLENGELVIKLEAVSNAPQPGFSYYSGRIRTHKLKEFQYGRIEAKIKLPAAGGS
ncbi:MAG: hypothetical protein KGZ86_08220 [Candidatus Latescibacteria bacterium]|nr:hypothetical protein [Candidatus Latescibacterota bacterium]